MKNFWFLFTAYTLIWAGLVVYLWRLSTMRRRIDDRLGEIRRLIGRPPGG